MNYDEVLRVGRVMGSKLRRRSSEKGVVVTTNVNSKGERLAIAISFNICKELDLHRGESFNIVELPNGRICLCKVREALGFKLTGNSTRSRSHYLYIPRFRTVKDTVIGVIEDGLIMFEAGSFEATGDDSND